MVLYARRAARRRPPAAARRGAVACALAAWAAHVPMPAAAQAGPAAARVSDAQTLRVEERAKAILAIMGFAAVPDLTSSFLSISDGSASNPSLALTQIAGGFTLGTELPLYLEGGIAWSRYDPVFVLSDGTDSREVPLKWTSAVATAGVGWDVRLAPHLTLRPIATLAIGHMESDLSILERVLGDLTGIDLGWLEKGRLNAWGYGGALMLDYERFSPEHDVDLEARYSYVRLKGYGSELERLLATAEIATFSLYGRWRAPTGAVLLERPLRYVLEGAFSSYLGDQRGVLGFDWLGSVGAGLELDTSAVVSWFSRVRLVARYSFGNNVRGTAVSLALSF